MKKAGLFLKVRLIIGALPGSNPPSMEKPAQAIYENETCFCEGKARKPLVLLKNDCRSFLIGNHGGGGWIRTTEVSDNRFTVCPLWPLGNSSILNWSWWTDSNPRPADYKRQSGRQPVGIQGFWTLFAPKLAGRAC